MTMKLEETALAGATRRVVRRDDVKPITWGGEEASRFLLRSEDTGGRYSFYEVSVPPGEGSLFHVHEDTDESFYVIEGEFEIKLGTDVHKASAGVLVYGPRGVWHSFFNTWHRPSRMLCITTPGGIEKFFEELSELMSGDLPPDWHRMQELATRHRIVAGRPQGGDAPAPPPAGTNGQPDQEQKGSKTMSETLPRSETRPMSETRSKPPRQLFLRPKTKPPSKASKVINKAIVSVNVHLYRRSSGKVLGRFGRLDALLITTLGRRTGRARTNPVGYLWDNGRFVICAAYGGEAVHPAWYLNLLAVPRATVEIGRERIEVTAESLPPGPERDRLWKRLVDVFPGYAKFQNRTTRLLPVVVLTPTDLVAS